MTTGLSMKSEQPMATDDFDPRLPISQPRPNHIDVDAVIARARRRRRPGRIGVGLVTTLAVVGLFGGGIFGLSRFVGSSGASSSAESGGSVAAPDSAPVPSIAPRPTGPLPATCGRSLPALAPTADGLVVTVTAKKSADHSYAATITLTNTGQKAVRGHSDTASVLLARGGIVVWHSPPTDPLGPGIEVDLAPGASLQIMTTFDATICGVGDDPGGVLRTGLPAAPPGSYQLYGEVRLDNLPGAEIASGPPKTLTLH
jgi:hypothetical protein